MIEGQFSRTALSAAAFRAAHQTCDGAAIFADPYASALLGPEEAPLVATNSEPTRRKLRAFIALRSRVAEDVARRAVAKGVRQVVVLGAGLDTFAYRLAPLAGLRVFEVDHADTQAEKRRRLAAAHIPIPAHLTFAPCDFERQALSDALKQAGFGAAKRAVYLWLGVTPYLTPEAVSATLRFVAGNSGGADIVFDYANPPATIAAAETRAFHDAMAARVAAQGEAFRGYFETPALHTLLTATGFAGFHDLGPREIAARLNPGGPAPAEGGGHILHAWTA